MTDYEFNGTRYVVGVTLDDEQRASARRIADALVAIRRGDGTAVGDYRLAMRASREQHGDDLHEIVKAHAHAWVSGGRA